MLELNHSALIHMRSKITMINDPGDIPYSGKLSREKTFAN